MTRTIFVGTHSVTREAERLLFIRYAGDLSGGDMIAMYDAIELLADGKRDIFTVNDLSRIGDVSGEARKLVGKDPRASMFAAVAVVGASFTVRIVSTMTVRAARLLNVGIIAPMQFFDNERDARAWIEELRRKSPEPKAALHGLTGQSDSPG